MTSLDTAGAEIQEQPLIQVIGIGLDGAAGLAPARIAQIKQAQVLIGSDRHLAYFPNHPGQIWSLGVFQATIGKLRQHLEHYPQHRVVILTSGDPLFFGLGRLLLAELPQDWLLFYPHPSSIQLAFSRLKLPWQDARLLSAHGRSLDTLTEALQQGADKIAVLTDSTHSPAAIARLLDSLQLSVIYQLWVCENLGDATEQIRQFSPNSLPDADFASLNVVVLVRQEGETRPLESGSLPPFGLSDDCFLSFPDRPGLMTKREVRILALAELALLPGQIVWDVGAGTGSVSLELARLQPSATLYAIEKTAMGASLIQQNCDRFGIPTIQIIQGKAPAALAPLPYPDRVFIGGSSGTMTELLTLCCDRLRPRGRIVAAIATLETLAEVTQWLRGLSEQAWTYRLLQVQLSRSVAVGPLTRFSPLNPVTLVTLYRE
ncbi:MAG: precorrin-6y C5,15-methyltransferase (decarboxylating) subunit CbiE [Cyanobacteria bacterium J06635_15]